MGDLGIGGVGVRGIFRVKWERCYSGLLLAIKAIVLDQKDGR